jgi:hypothetical protein
VPTEGSRPLELPPSCGARFGARFEPNGLCCHSRSTMRALIFNLDGIFVETVSAHVIAWERA